MSTEIPGFLENVSKTNYGRKALLCYTTAPFVVKNMSLGHVNILRVRLMAKLLDEFEYDVDVVEYLLSANADYPRYELLIGFGYPYENSFYFPFRGKRIFYATEAMSSQKTPAVLFRLKKIQQRRGVLLPARRLKAFPDFSSSILSDAIFCQGNEWTIGTYREVFDGKIYKMPGLAFSFYQKPQVKRDIEKSRNSFIWFGGPGFVFKGLDLCIEAFLQCPNLELHICGPSKYEEEFLDLYSNELKNSENITFHGFVDVQSESFREIAEKSMFTIFPSSSEGIASSVLTMMATGMIPVVTRESGVDTDGFGFEIPKPEIDTIVGMIQQVSAIETEELERRSGASYEYVMHNHTLDVFEKEFRRCLKDVLG